MQRSIDGILWMHVRTTGLTQVPLQIAMATTDFYGENLDDQLSSVVATEEFLSGEYPMDTDSWHEAYASGLLLELESFAMGDSPHEQYSALAKVHSKSLDSLIAKMLSGRKFNLGGFSPHTFEPSLSRFFPYTYATTVNPNVDASTLDLLLEMGVLDDDYMEIDPEVPAADFVQQAIAKYRKFSDLCQ